MLRSELSHFLHPVGVVVPVLKVSPRLIVVYLTDIGGSGVRLARIIIFLLDEHGVVVTIEQVVALWLPCARELIREVDTRLSTATSLRCDLDNSVCTTRPPYCGSCCILQHVNLCNILHIDREERRVFLFRRILKVEVLVRIVEYLSIYNDKRFCITIDGGDTTKSHRRTSAEVT